MMFPLLKAEDIDVRIQSEASNGSFVCLLYKDARCDQKYLDEIIGIMNWQNSYELIDGQLFCTIKVWDKDKSQWVCKQNVGIESKSQAEKGRASDAFKRACFNLGIGRELYTSPSIFCKPTKKGKYEKYKVSKIAYDENRNISELEIVDSSGAVSFTHRSGKKGASKAKADKPKEDGNSELRLMLYEKIKATESAMGKKLTGYTNDMCVVFYGYKFSDLDHDAQVDFYNSYEDKLKEYLKNERE